MWRQQIDDFREKVFKFEETWPPCENRNFYNEAQLVLGAGIASSVYWQDHAGIGVWFCGMRKSSYPRHWMEINGHFHASAVLSHWIGGLISLRDGLDIAVRRKITAPAGNRSFSQSLDWLSYPGFICPYVHTLNSSAVRKDAETCCARDGQMASRRASRTGCAAVRIPFRAWICIRVFVCS
jgi:hypothetical protein